MADPEDLFGPDDELDQLAVQLRELVYEFAEENDLPPSFISAVALEIAVQSRMVAYAAETEQPSVTGLKLDLDRMRRDADVIVGEAKKGAAEFIRTAKEAIEEFGDDDEG